MGTLYENILQLCKEHQVKPGKVCNELGLSRGLMTDLKMGRKKSLNAETADKIASYFDVSVGYLLGTETKKAPMSEDMSAMTNKELFQEIMKRLDRLSPDQFRKAEEYIDLLILQQEQNPENKK